MAHHWWWSITFIVTVLGTSLLGAQAAPTITSSDPPQPTRPACGTIINDPDGALTFDASLVFDCLNSVPFNPAVALRFLKYYNDTLSFQTTISDLKNPPSTYQQPSVDLLGGIQSLQDAVQSGSFKNQYEFEAALQLLVNHAHDDHLFLNAGVMSAFTFGSPFDIVSLSVDGEQMPKAYLATDVLDSNAFTSFKPSAIRSINGQDATTYLENFAAANVAGSVDPHTDWNRLMFSFAEDIQGSFNVFTGLTPFFPGETITFELENGTTISERNTGIYWNQGPTGPLETGGDFYNFFVLGFLPASFDPIGSFEIADPTAVEGAPATIATPEIVTPSPLSWNSPAYPTIPEVAQPDLGLLGGGVISGYFLNSSSVSVLSIPSFDQVGDNLNTAQATVNDFIRRTKNAGLQKVVIDLQGNRGGQVVLAVSIFKQFFPDIEPFGGSRMRATHSTNVMGETMTDYFNQLSETDPDRSILSSVEWVATTRIDAETGSNFTSWGQFAGPVLSGEGAFTETQRFNFSNEVFVDNLVDLAGNFSIISPPARKSTPWAPENIIILTDGSCSSACALFVEMMHHEAGVRTVTVGGRPSRGPMQAVGGTRGARSLSTDILDNNINFARELLVGTDDAAFLPNRTEALDVFIVDASVNLRDQVRAGQTTSLQFAYEAANCRIFFTPATIFNYKALWQYAADAIWTNPSLCVAGSTGYTAHSSTNSSTKAPPVSKASPFVMADYVTIDPNMVNSTVDVDDVGELSGDLLAGQTLEAVRFTECSELSDDPSFFCADVFRCFDDPIAKPTAVLRCGPQDAQTPCFAGTGPGQCLLTSAVDVGCIPFQTSCTEDGRALRFALQQRQSAVPAGLGAGLGTGTSQPPLLNQPPTSNQPPIPNRLALSDGSAAPARPFRPRLNSRPIGEPKGVSKRGVKGGSRSPRQFRQRP
ncbi:hypothetical protein F4808DRAFT_470940 [Astrocystis sublimbata]|nr:hypothetical protein F4808DRAFT_470940 [Astrocystis sublimbata]